MAINTEDKRRSASSTSVPIMVLPIADNTINQADRQHVSFIYRGIAAASAAAQALHEITVNIVSVVTTAVNVLSLAAKSTDITSLDTKEVDI